MSKEDKTIEVVFVVPVKIEYDSPKSLNDALDDIKKHFNRKYNKTSKISCGGPGNTYSWSYINKDATTLNPNL